MPQSVSPKNLVIMRNRTKHCWNIVVSMARIAFYSTFYVSYHYFNTWRGFSNEFSTVCGRKKNRQNPPHFCFFAVAANYVFRHCVPFFRSHHNLYFISKASYILAPKIMRLFFKFSFSKKYRISIEPYFWARF